MSQPKVYEFRNTFTGTPATVNGYEDTIFATEEEVDAINNELAEGGWALAYEEMSINFQPKSI